MASFHRCPNCNEPTKPHCRGMPCRMWKCPSCKAYGSHQTGRFIREDGTRGDRT
jgi:hypothetical protein